mgnify:CR=1 FL=1
MHPEGVIAEWLPSKVGVVGEGTHAEVRTVPVGTYTLAIVFHLEGYSGLSISLDTLASIYAGEVTHWNDSAIAQSNAHIALPPIPITYVCLERV